MFHRIPIFKLLDEIEDGYRLKSEAELIYLLDTKDDDSYGGTGKAFDWRLARQISDEAQYHDSRGT